MAQALITALPSLISAATLAAMSFVARHVRGMVGDFETIRRAERDQIRMTIVGTYGTVERRGWISTQELSSVNSLYESYRALGGNSFVHTLVRRLNEDYEIRKR